jgi:hypothetical protein
MNDKRKLEDVVEDVGIEMAHHIGYVADAIRSLNDITLSDGSQGSVMIGVSQALFQLSEAVEQISKDFTRYVDHVTDDSEEWL